MNIHVFSPSFRAAALHMLSHVPWTRIKHLTRGCLHPWVWLGHHCWGVKGHAPWEQNQRSNWVQNPQSWAASRLFNHGDGWYSGSGENRVVGGWNHNNSHLQKKRSGSCNSSWSPYSGALSLEHSAWFDRNFRQSFPRLHEASFSHHHKVGDAHRELCLFLLLFFGEDHFWWLCDAHWGQCLSKLRLSFEHHFWWLCDAHWGQCLSKLHLTCEYHFWWLCDAHWGQCVSKLHLTCEHHFWWLCDTHWGQCQCLSNMHLFEEHHSWWLCDADWEACLWRLHHVAPLRWVNLCRTFLTVPSTAAPLSHQRVLFKSGPPSVEHHPWFPWMGTPKVFIWGSRTRKGTYQHRLLGHGFSQVAHGLYVPF